MTNTRRYPHCSSQDEDIRRTLAQVPVSPFVRQRIENLMRESEALDKAIATLMFAKFRGLRIYSRWGRKSE